MHERRELLIRNRRELFIGIVAKLFIEHLTNYSLRNVRELHYIH